MTDFLFLLAKINLAMAGAILVVALLRRPMRAAFHAPVSYALWLLVPAAMLASLLPPRADVIASHPVSMKIPAVMGQALQTRLVAQAAPMDWTVWLFAIWLAGAGTMLLVMAWQQRQFNKAERRGAAGPAVTGFLRPRIVIPAGFAAQFSLPEQAAILAHEKAHLARQDARINAAVALMRCLCWFNPLVHLAAHWLRKDQELACDAAAVRQVTRGDYANALLKSQMRAMALPLGCSWPGREHPLTERIALLKAPAPGRKRSIMGIGAIVSLILLAGVGAWAAQPAEGASGPQHTFTGVVFYAERDGKSGQPLFLTLESDDGRNAKGKPMLGHEVLHFPYGVAWADSAIYDLNTLANPSGRTVTLSGNVTLLTGPSGLKGFKGEKLVFDVRTGLFDFDGKIMPSGMPKYVPCTKGCKRIEK